MLIKNQMKNKAAGVVYGILAFTVWGFLPLYWKLLKQIPANEILAHRIFWSFIFVLAILVASSGIGKLKAVLADTKSLMLIVACAVLISINWFTYIWAVNNNHIVESSMGYYINPLMSVFLGVTVLKEKLNLYQYIALIFALAGVCVITISYGSFPWIALVLAISFALYGLVKKMVKVDSLTGLALETAVLMPLAAAFLIYKQVKGIGALGNVPLPTTILIMLAGVATAMPLLWFAKGARRVELSTIGFLQYISPTISLFLGIFVYGERFSTIHIISFGFIWAGLSIYSLSKTRVFESVQLKFSR